MANNANLCIRIDPELKSQAELLFSELGMSLTTAITVYFRQAVRESKIPFEIKWERPNRATASAMREAADITRDRSVKGYEDPKELFRELGE